MLGIHRKVPKIEPKPKLPSEAVLTDAVEAVLGDSGKFASRLSSWHNARDRESKILHGAANREGKP